MGTINDLAVVTSVGSGDKIPLWSNVNGVTRGLPISVLDDRYLSQDEVALLAASATVETFLSGTDFTPGVSLALTLKHLYYSNANIEVFFDAAFQGPDQYSLAGYGLVFTSPIPVGVQNVYVRGGAARLVGAPSQGTVTDSTVASGSDLSVLLLNRAVDSIAQLRGLSKLKYARSFVMGYYAALDGAGGTYVLDALDTTSADNGGTVIVGNDGGRWKLKYDTYVTAEQFGALGNGTGNDAPFINAALNAVGVVHLRPNGTYRLTTQIIVPFGGCLRGPGEGLFVGVKYQTFGVQGWKQPEGVAAIAVAFGAGSTDMVNSAVRLSAQARIHGISFYYPDQLVSTTAPIPYPATISLLPGSDSNVASRTVTAPSVTSCHFSNPWMAINFSVNHVSAYVAQCTGYAWDCFAYFDESYDTNRLQNCQINSTFSYYGDFPANGMINYQYATTTSECLRIGKADAMEINDVYSFGFYKGLSFNVFGVNQPNGIFVNGGGWEGCFFPVVMATAFRRITLRGVQFGSQPLGVSGGGQSVRIGNPTNNGTASEVRLIGCTSFTSIRQAVSIGNVNDVLIDSCEWFNSNSVNQGFVTGVFDIHNSNQVKIVNNNVEQNSGNPNGQYGNISNSNGLIVANNTLTGQQYTGSNFFVGNSAAVRFTNNLEQKVSGLFGTGVVFSSCTQATSDNYIQY